MPAHLFACAVGVGSIQTRLGAARKLIAHTSRSIAAHRDAREAKGRSRIVGEDFDLRQASASNLAGLWALGPHRQDNSQETDADKNTAHRERRTQTNGAR